MHDKKNSQQKVQNIKNKIAEGYSPNFGFLHIPKTGGTSVVHLGTRLVESGYQFPVHFGHPWTVEDVMKAFPKMGLVFILRDPLERMISGFNSRLRQGRPTYHSMWTHAEASAMAMLPSARHLLDAMLADDDFSVSAVAFAMKKVSHLRWNYRYYFKNVESVRKHSSTFRVVGHMDDFQGFINRLSELSGASADTAGRFSELKHASPKQTSSHLAHYSPDEVLRLRNRLPQEYAIYTELCKLDSFCRSGDQREIEKLC